MQCGASCDLCECEGCEHLPPPPPMCNCACGGAGQCGESCSACDCQGCADISPRPSPPSPSPSPSPPKPLCNCACGGAGQCGPECSLCDCEGCEDVADHVAAEVLAAKDNADEVVEVVETTQVGPSPPPASTPDSIVLIVFWGGLICVVATSAKCLKQGAGERGWLV